MRSANEATSSTVPSGTIDIIATIIEKGIAVTWVEKICEAVRPGRVVHTRHGVKPDGSVQLIHRLEEGNEFFRVKWVVPDNPGITTPRRPSFWMARRASSTAAGGSWIGTKATPTESLGAFAHCSAT
mgnify:CR=1 FL=1